MGGQSRYHYDFYVRPVPKKRVEVKRSVGYSIYTLERCLQPPVIGQITWLPATSDS